MSRNRPPRAGAGAHDREEGRCPVGEPPSGPWQEAREGEFEMMDVSVSILGVTGIVNEFVKTKKKPVGPGPKKTSNSFAASGASAMSSLESSKYDVDDIPITAVASFYKNVKSSKTKIGTHLPSLPLGMPTSAFGNTSRFMASWPSPFESSRPSRHEVNNTGAASFKFSRVMKRQIIPGSWDGEDPSIIEGAGHGVFIPEMFDVHVGLARGTEMLPLGVATLVVTGGEVGEVQVNLPIKTGADIAKNMDGSEMKKGGAKLFKGKTKSGKQQNKKAPYFKCNPSSRYRLDDAATLRLLVKAVPRNGGYDVDGSDVSALSCPTGSSDGSSVDDYDDDYDEPSTPRSPRAPLSPLNSPSPHANAHAPKTKNLDAPQAQVSQAVHALRKIPSEASSEASSEPGYGDEFEGASPRAPPPPESRPLKPTKIHAETYSKGSKETEATSKTSLSEGSLLLQEQARTKSSSCNMSKAPACNFFSCGTLDTALCHVVADKKKGGIRKKSARRRPPRQVFTHSGTQSNSLNSLSSKSASPRDRRRPRGRGRRDKSKVNYHEDVDETFSDGSSSSSDSSQSVGSRTFKDVEQAREKLRRYAHKMGVHPEDLV